jgi:AcrR family transcriptional regulator
MALADRRQQYRESLRQEILDAARELFVRQGYEATSIRRIAEKVGCSPGIIYHYFEDKPAVMAQLVRETFAQMNARVSMMANDDAPPLDNLRRALRAYIEFGIQNPHHYSILFRKQELFGNSPQIAEAYRNDGLKTFDCMRAVVKRAMDSGVLRPELTDTEEIAQALWASIHGMISIQIGAKGFPFIEQSRLIDRLVDILITGIKQ